MTIDGLPLTFFFPGEDGMPVPPMEGDVVSQAEKYFMARANLLPTDQRARFLARVRDMAGQILGRIQEMRQSASSADEIRIESETLFNQLKSTGDKFLAETELFSQARVEQNRKFDSFDQRLQNMKLELSRFAPPPPTKSVDFAAILAAGRKAKMVEYVALANLPRRYRHCTRDDGCTKSVLEGEIPKDKGVYFHATGMQNVIDILKSGKVERRDNKVYQGAFVSTKPEIIYGKVVLVFNRTIEKLAGPVISAQYAKDSGAHWAGFSGNIPVNTETLECVAVGDVKGDLTNLSQQLSQAAGREIKVVPLGPIIQERNQKAAEEGIFVPEEWPFEMKFNSNLFQRNYIY
jgi:hypothetical protein